MSRPAALFPLILERATSSSSLVKSPSLMSREWLIMVSIGVFEVTGTFPNRVEKCSFHLFSRSFSFLALIFALLDFFRPVISLTVFQASEDCLLS